jgi:S1-C subfamily serine protease
MKLFFCVALQLFAIYPSAIYASDTSRQTIKNCDKAWKLVKQDWDNDSALLSEARDYLTHCSAEMSDPSRVRLLGQMGGALIHTKQYSEATPILEQCAKTAAKDGLNGDYASCWERLGEAAAFQGNCEGAIIGFKAALDVPTTDNLSSSSHQLARYLLETLYTNPAVKCLPPNTPSSRRADLAQGHLYGTAFFISVEGLLLTNDHVVSGCKTLTLGAGTQAQIVSRDPRNDLALLKASDKAQHFVKFRSGEPARVGEPVIAFGFPFPGTLSSGGVATNGIVSSLSGVNDDPRTLQFSAAIQPGNSGGPLFDGSGHVIGIVEAKLDALHVASVTGAIPENVGFAIQWAQIKAFLETEDVTATREQSKISLSSSDIASFAQLVTVSVDCTY